ncbi:MAG: ankyrin repeat domain-containing protein [Deltaproteobacteria bacterium]|nr:ankyrin repeat domain-containing protein [Deltaproteobacteria bacterium]
MTGLKRGFFEGRFFVFLPMLSFVLVAGCAGSLFKAAGDGDVAAIKSLVASGEGINAFDGMIYLYTPLMAAAIKGKMDAVKTLLELGADPLAEDDDGFTAAKLARKRGHTEIADILAEAETKRRLEFGPSAPVARPPSNSPEDAEFALPPPQGFGP